MKKMMTLALAALTATCAFAELKEVAADIEPIQASAEDEVESSRFRLSAGGFGRFGLEGHAFAFGEFSGFKDNAELYGTGLDVQFNLLPMESFNLWIGLGGRYMPEQDFLDYSQTVKDPQLSMTYQGKVDVKAYDLRVMVVPEWVVLDQLAFGLRAGVGFGHYDAELKETATLSGFVSSSASASAKFSETAFQGVLGLQVTWMFSEHVGLYAYGDGIFGEDIDLSVNGKKVGRFDNTSFEAGIGITAAF